MPTNVWVATANIYVGEGSAYVLAYTPGNRVPDSVVASLGLAASGLVQQATINEDGTSPNWRGTDPITRSELDLALADLDLTGAVDTVNGQTGVVVLDADDIADTASKVLMLPAERTKLSAVAAGATANSTDAQLRDRTTHTGTQTSATLSDLTEVVQDIVAAFIVAGTNVTATYNDAANTYTINATASGGTTDPEIVRDTIGGALVAGAGVTITVNDAGDTITVASTAVLPTRQVISGTGLSGGGDLSADRTLSVAYGSAAGTAAQGNDTRIVNAVQTTDARVTADQAAATASIRTIGTGALQAAAGNHTHTGLSAASETASGIVELATAAETTTGTDNTRAVHPAGLKVELDKKAPLLTATNSQSVTAYTLVLADAGVLVEATNAAAVALTVPPNSSVAFAVGTTVVVRQYGAGQITLTPGVGVTLRSRGAALKTAGQYAEATLTKRATDEWIVSGDVTT